MRLRERLGSACKWLYPGMGVKRWLVLLGFGLLMLSLGVSFFYVQIYRNLEFTGAASPIAYNVTLQFLPRSLRGLLLVLFGTLCVIIAVYRLSHSLVSLFYDEGQGSFVDAVYRRRIRRRGPKVVAIGGGTGLSTLLRGLKERTDNLTAIVTVADDGGSSGRLRKELGLPPPGDFRSCISALAEAEPLMALLFQYRFGQGLGLDGHSFGNLFIAAMTGVTGDFAQAIRQSSKVLAVRGRVLPSTMQSVTLGAEVADDQHQIQGESQIPRAGVPIERVFLQPDDVRGYGEAVQALLGADVIVVGPGSLYTSILPNLLVRDIAAAIRASDAVKVYVCNVATQPGETDGYTVSDHLRAIENHVGDGLFDYVLANSRLDVTLPAEWNTSVVRPGDAGAIRVWLADVVDVARPWRHDPAKLTRELLRIQAESKARR